MRDSPVISGMNFCAKPKIYAIKHNMRYVDQQLMLLGGLCRAFERSLEPQQGHFIESTCRYTEQLVHLFCPILYRNPFGVRSALYVTQIPLQDVDMV